MLSGCTAAAGLRWLQLLPACWLERLLTAPASACLQLSASAIRDGRLLERQPAADSKSLRKLRTVALLTARDKTKL